MLSLWRICLPCRMRMAWKPLLLLNARSQARGYRLRRFGVDGLRTAADNAMDKKYDELVFDAMGQEWENKPKPSGEPAEDSAVESDIEIDMASRWKRFSSKYDYPGATHSINELDESHSGKVVVLHGHFISPRSRNFLCFFSIIDFSFGRSTNFPKDRPLQVVSFITDQSSPELVASHKMLQSLKPYTPVAVVGTVVVPPVSERRIVFPRERLDRASLEDTSDPDKQERKIANIEIRMEKIYPLNDISEDLMFTRDSVFTPKDRHLQIKLDARLRKALRVRAKTASLCRSILEERGFLEVETPLLFKSTPEGAREFLVPTRNEGMMYALPQSPQQYKQILMASGIYRYYQLAKCFRDEDLRADRQPEFTQLDIEMSFTKSSDVMEVVSDLIMKVWKTVNGKDIPKIWQFSYDMVMRRYGNDKPDLRYNHSRIRDVSAIVPYLKNSEEDIVEAFVLETFRDPEIYNYDIGRNLHDTVFSQPELKEAEGESPMISFAGDFSRNAHYIQNKADINLLRRFLSGTEDQIVVVQARKRKTIGGHTKLGLVRDALLQEAWSQGVVHRVFKDMFVWVTDFPLFKTSTDAEPGQDGTSGISANHHPFTAPKLEDLHLLEKDPLSVRAEHYDLVVNGMELGGGSARIHDPELQRYVLEEVIKVPEKKMQQFEHLLKVLGSGCPPHAGIALGFDRLIAVLTGAGSVRDVIAFPKNGKGQDMLVNSPGMVDDKDLEPYFLRQVKKGR